MQLLYSKQMIQKQIHIIDKQCIEQNDSDFYKQQINCNYNFMQAKPQHIINKKLIQVRQIKNSQSMTPTFQVSNAKVSKKSPQKIRNNMRMNKLKKGHRMTNPQHIDNQILNIEYLREKQKKIMLNTRQIFNFFPTYTTINEKLQAKEFAEEIFYFQDDDQIKNRHINFIRDEQRVIYERKKLAPIRKGSNVETKKLEKKKSTNISFLNVQKVPILPVYIQTASDKQKMSMTSSLLHKKGVFLARQSFDEQSRTIQQSQLGLTSQGFFKQDIIPTIARNKPFVPPFERYYYHDFVWKVGFSNKIKIDFPETYQKKFKVYIGGGNNSMLIKTLMKRRQAWWILTDRVDEAHFVWTQIKVNQLFNCQPRGQAAQQNSNIVQENEKKKKYPIYKRNNKILNEIDVKKWIDYYDKNKDTETKMLPTMSKRNKMIKINSKVLNLQKTKLHNHMPQNFMLGNKKALFYTMSQYYEALDEQTFKYLPLTFHIQDGIDGAEYLKFLKIFYERAKITKKCEVEGFKGRKIRNIWIVKPGQFTNRGNGIRVCLNLEQIKKILKKKQRHENGNLKTYIIQNYIDRPFLYYRRKFDIRHFMMISSVNGHMKGYWYEVGYIRTTSYQYTVKNSFTSVHLTNDAVQKNLPDYGKFQKGNKISYDDLQKYLKRQFNGKYSFYRTIYPEMKKIAIDSMRASSRLIDPDRRTHNFEIFGFDFMIDSDFHPWLIQINTNPCLQLSCPLLLQIIPAMIENALKIGVDSIFPPPATFQEKRAKFNNNILEQNKFELVFDSTLEQKLLQNVYKKSGQMILDCKQLEKDIDEVFQDDGVELDD